ncbi:MAG: Wzz/FepE/Etk N-terminal domain-containing protein [Balneolaceae bacterium]|nr:Wzz/FepE/Etk N-terminal domain-containing protein [Balneolaceae bacterium]
MSGKEELSDKQDSISESPQKFQSLDIIEIDLYEKVKVIWDSRITIIFFMVVFLGIGYFHAEYGPVEYTSTSSLIQESEGASVGDFGSSFLSSLTGMNIRSGGGGNMSAVATGRAPLPVSLYPPIINSTEFQKELIHTEVEFSTLDTTITLREYFHDHKEVSLREKVYDLVMKMTIYLPETVYDWLRKLFRNAKQSFLSFFQNDNIEKESNSTEANLESIEDPRLQSVTSEESAVIEWLKLRIGLTSDGGIMVITATLPDPKAAALINAELVEYIQEYITDYRIKKAKQNLNDTLERYELAKKRYEEAQYELAKYRDENINVSTQTASIQEDRLSNEASLRFDIYNSIAQEVEQARMVLQQQIPVFNPLEKPNIPSSSSTGSSPLLLVFSGVLGFFAGTGLVLIRNSSLIK